MNGLEEQIFEAKKNGLTDQEIGEKYNVNLRFIEKVMTKRLVVNISSPTMQKKIKTLQPKNKSPERYLFTCAGMGTHSIFNTFGGCTFG